MYFVGPYNEVTICIIYTFSTMCAHKILLQFFHFSNVYYCLVHKILQIFMGNVFDHNSLCAVCQTSRHDDLMIPKTYSNPPFWTREYIIWVVDDITRQSWPIRSHLCGQMSTGHLWKPCNYTLNMQASDISNIEAYCLGTSYTENLYVQSVLDI